MRKTSHMAAGSSLPLALLLSVSACESPPDTRLPTHVVCHSGGLRVVDDFGTSPHLMEGGILYDSRTTGRRVRVTGDCAAFNDVVPDDWKPVLPGMTKDIQR